MTDPHFAAFATADIDTPGTPGGSINNLHPDVLAILTKMRQLQAAPGWIGINPTNGKAQLIWAIDPVYSDGDPTKPNRPMKLLKRVQHGLTELLNGDTAFAHGFMRNPLYSGPNPNAYRWNCYPFRIHKLKDLEAMLEQLGALTTAPDKTPTPAKTGTDLILQAKANRERAQRMRALSDELDGLSVEELERHAPSYIQGVRVLYDAAGTPQRDETAFRHALKTAHRAHKRGQRLKDNLIIDAYEHAYRIAHAQDTLGRPDETPPCATASPWPAASAPTPPPTRPSKRPEQASAPPNTSPPPNAAHYAPSAHAAARKPPSGGTTPPKPSTRPTPANPSKPQTNAASLALPR